MKIGIVKDNGDGTVTVKADEITKAEQRMEAAAESFNTGHGKGRDKGKQEGRAEILSKLSFLDIDPENLDTSLNAVKQQIIDLKAGKGKEADLLKELQEKLTKKTEAYDATQNKFESFKRESLITSQLRLLAEKYKTFDSDETVVLFNNTFKTDLDERNKVVVTQKNGDGIFDQDGNPRSLDDIFSKVFVKNKPYLFKDGSSGGSGGGIEGAGGTVTFADLKTDEQKAEFVSKHGVDEYQKLMEMAQAK